MSRPRDIGALAGLTGLVLFGFGVASYGLTRRFDLWTAVHFTGGAILTLLGVALNLPALSGVTRSRAGRDRMRAAVGATAALAVLVLATVLAGRAGLRWDLTRDDRHTLSTATVAAIGDLVDDVRVTVFAGDDDPGVIEVDGLLERLDAASPRVEARRLDPAVRPELALAFEVDRVGTVVVESGARVARDVIPLPRLDERALVTSIRRVTVDGVRSVGFVVGHGEAKVDDLASPDGGALFARVLADAAFDVRTVGPGELLARGPDAPAVVVLAGPASPLGPDAVDALLGAVDRGGNALLLVEPGIDPTLRDALLRRGIVTGDDVVVDPTAGAGPAGTIGVEFVTDEWTDHPANGDTEAPVVFRVAQSVDAAPGSDAAVLVRSSADAWAERDVASLVERGRVARDGGDLAGPVPLAVAWESPAGGRLVVVGDADFARNARLGAFGGRTWVLALATWLVGEDAPEVPWPMPTVSRLDLDAASFRTLVRGGVVLLPEVVLVVGLAVWWWRRRR